MNLKDVLHSDCITVDLAAETKDDVITEMIDLLDAAGQLPDRACALKAVMDREQKMSTGMQNGIAIPHGKCDRVDELLTAIAIRREPIDFESLDGEPCSIFVMTLSPPDRTGPHIQFLSEVSRVLGEQERRQRLIAAQTPEDVLQILSE